MLNQAYLDSFTKFNPDGDGIDEINQLKLLSFEDDNEGIPYHSKLILVLVEPRLLDYVEDGPSASDLIIRLERLKEDLWLEGYTSRFILADVYAGSEHQDGRSVLALREFFQGVWRKYHTFQGVILIGSFPETMIVRRWLWKKHGNVEINGADHQGVDFLSIRPGIWAARSDIVLTDLNGNWDMIYEKGPSTLDSILAIPDAATNSTLANSGQEFSSNIFEKTQRTFKDFFLIQDDDFLIVEENAGFIKLALPTSWHDPEFSKRRWRDPELNFADRLLPNPMARPDIQVSRINARHVAFNPNTIYQDINGRTLLADDGKPQEIEAALGETPPVKWHLNNEPCPALERKLLIEYLDRNHRFREGKFNEIRFRPAAIASEDFSAGSLSNYLKEASDEFEGPVVFEDASLLDYVKFLKKSAILKGIHAHSTSRSTAFSHEYQEELLDDEVGERPWHWQQIENTQRYRLTLATKTRASLYVHRTLYENKILSDSVNSFFIHLGCLANAPIGAKDEPYTSEEYGSFQNAEGILFYCNGLALVARSKTFYDKPRKFPKAFGAEPTSRFGDGLAAYFAIDAHDSSIRSKRAYMWSILGDWTLRLRYHRRLEDCISFDSGNVNIKEEPQNLGVISITQWLITDGTSRMLFCPSLNEAQRIKNTIQHYDLSEQCFVGRPDPSMEYWLSAHQAPVGYLADEDAIPINIYNLRILRSGNYYIVTDGLSRLIGCPSYEEAAMVIYILRKYRFSRQCFIGRPRPSMTYYRKSVC